MARIGKSVNKIDAWMFVNIAACSIFYRVAQMYENYVFKKKEVWHTGNSSEWSILFVSIILKGTKEGG